VLKQTAIVRTAVLGEFPSRMMSNVRMIQKMGAGYEQAQAE